MKSTIADRFYDIVVSPPSEVIDNLTSNSPTASLSARQGKVLKDLIENSNSSGTVNYDIMAGASPVQVKTYRRYQNERGYNNSAITLIHKTICSSNNAIYTIEEPINSSNSQLFPHNKKLYLSCIKNNINKINKWIPYSELSRPEIDTYNGKIRIYDSAFSPQLNKICIVGSHGYIGLIDCSNTNDIILQRSTFSTNFFNLGDYTPLKQFFLNLFELPSDISSTFDSWRNVFSSVDIFKINSIRWIESQNKFYAMSSVVYQSGGNYHFKTLILSSNDGMDWQKVSVFPGILANWCYADHTNKFYAIHQFRRSTGIPNSDADYNSKLMVSINNCASWTEVPINGKPNINDLYNFYLGGIAYSKTKKTCVIYGALSYKSLEPHDYQTRVKNYHFIVRSINDGPFQIDTSLKNQINEAHIYTSGEQYILNKNLVWIPEIDTFVSTSTVSHEICISKDGIKWFNYSLNPAHSTYSYYTNNNVTVENAIGMIIYLKYTNEIYLVSYYNIGMDKVIQLSA